MAKKKELSVLAKSNDEKENTETKKEEKKQSVPTNTQNKKKASIRVAKLAETN